MNDSQRADQAFQDLLEGRSSSASPELERLSKLAAALEPASRPGPSPQFKARLRSTVLAHASASPEDQFAAALEGILEAPVEVKQLVAVAAALEPARLPVPDVSFRYQLRNRLLAEAARGHSPRERLRARVAAANARMRRSLRVVALTGAAAVMLFGSSLALAASTNALPGDSLYGVKRLHEAARLLPLSGEAEGRQLLGYARIRLAEIEALNERAELPPSEVFLDVLQDMDDQTSAGTSILLGVFEQTGEREVLDHVSTFAQVQARDLSRLIPELPESVRPAARDSLAFVGEAAAEVDKALTACGYCPPNNLINSGASFPDTQAAGQCACQPQPVTSGDGGPGTGGGSGSDDPGTPDPDPTDDPEPGPTEEPPVDVPDEVPDEVETPVEDILDDVLDPITDLLPTDVPTLPGAGDLLP